MGAGVSWRQNLKTAPVTGVNCLASVLVFLGGKQLLLNSWLGGFGNALLCGELALVAAVHWAGLNVISTAHHLETLIVVSVSCGELFLDSVELGLSVLGAFDKRISAVKESEVHIFNK